jgi:hypothetical protein
MRALKLLYLPSVFLVCCCVGRGQDQSSLSGNWHLTGSWEHKAKNTTRFFLSLGVVGDKVFGSGDLQTKCTGSAFLLHGRIASDGTFLLVAEGNNPKTGREILVRGKIPDAGSTGWPGHFVVSHILDKCPSRIEGDFVAAKVSPLKGVYSGTLLTRDRKPITVTVDISQGELFTFDDGNSFYGEVPLNATMTLNGSSFNSETLTAEASRPSSSRMQGDNWLLSFPVDSEFSVLLAGEVTDATLNTLRATLSYPSKDFAATGILTRR